MDYHEIYCPSRANLASIIVSSHLQLQLHACEVSYKLHGRFNQILPMGRNAKCPSFYIDYTLKCLEYIDVGKLNVQLALIFTVSFS